MGDKSPKATQKQTSQKQSKTAADKQKKDAVQAAKVVEKPAGKK